MSPTNESMSLKQRKLVPEVMDDPALDRLRHVHALNGLSRINAWSGSSRGIWSAVAQLARESNGRQIRILDVATGAGDIPLRIWRAAKKHGVDVEIRAIDISEVALEFARARAGVYGAPIQFERCNVLVDSLPAGYDLVTCSLFLHHLTRPQAIELLSNLKRATRSTVLVTDLLRSWSGLRLAQWVTRVFVLSDVLRTDGPRSVRAAFSRVEIQEMLGAAGLAGASVVSRWPCRCQATWKKDEGAEKQIFDG